MLGRPLHSVGDEGIDGEQVEGGTAVIRRARAKAHQRRLGGIEQGACRVSFALGNGEGKRVDALTQDARRGRLATRQPVPEVHDTRAR